MKYVIFLIAVLITMYSCSDELAASKVPSVVQNSINAKFPEAADIDWKKNNGSYEAEFDKDKVEYTVMIDSIGNIILYKYDIKPGELPAAIATTISNDYNGYIIDDAEIVEKDTMIYYQAELETKGKKDLKLVWLADGSLAKDLKYLN